MLFAQPMHKDLSTPGLDVTTECILTGEPELGLIRIAVWAEQTGCVPIFVFFWWKTYARLLTAQRWVTIIALDVSTRSILDSKRISPHLMVPIIYLQVKLLLFHLLTGTLYYGGLVSGPNSDPGGFWNAWHCWPCHFLSPSQAWS